MREDKSGKKSGARSAADKIGIRRRHLLLGTTSLVAASSLSARSPSAQAQQSQEILPQPEPPFRGKIGRMVKDSTPDFPKGVEAPAGAPNVLKPIRTAALHSTAKSTQTAGSRDLFVHSLEENLGAGSIRSSV